MRYHDTARQCHLCVFAWSGKCNSEYPQRKLSGTDGSDVDRDQSASAGTDGKQDDLVDSGTHRPSTPVCTPAHEGCSPRGPLEHASSPCRNRSLVGRYYGVDGVYEWY